MGFLLKGYYLSTNWEDVGLKLDENSELNPTFYQKIISKLYIV